MKINSQEKNVLIDKKLKEGKSYDQADLEVEMCNGFMENLKFDVRKYKQQIVLLQKENERLQKVINKNMVPITPPEERKLSNQDKNCSVKYLYRIMNSLDDIPMTKTRISQELRIGNYNIVVEGLNFLVKYKLIKCINANATNYYYK